MKMRTDFVTNSSSSSFVAFHIENKELYNFLTSIGFKFQDTEEGHFNERMSVELPSGEEMNLFDIEGEWVPSISDTRTISEWIIGLLIQEIEDVYPAKEEDEYSLFALEAIGILKENNIIEIDFDDIEGWSRTEVLGSINLDDNINNALTAAEAELNSGFEGDVEGLEFAVARNGYQLSISYGGCNEGDNYKQEIANRKFFIADISDNPDQDEDIKELLRNKKGVICDHIDETIDFVVCDDCEAVSDIIDMAEKCCIPVLSSNGIMYRYGLKELEDVDDLEDILFDCTYYGNFQEVFYDYGIGTVCRTKV